MPKDIKDLLSMHPRRRAMEIELAWATDVRDGNLSCIDRRKKYLVKGESEPDSDYNARANMAEYAPATPRAIAKVLNVALGKDPRRDEIDEGLTEYVNRCGRNGEPIADIIKDGLENALWGRFCVALIDRRAKDPGVIVETKADEIAAGLDRPYVVLYGAADVLDWRIEVDGRLAYIKLRTDVGMNAAGEYVTEFREVYADRIDLYVVTNKDGQAAVSSVVSVPTADAFAQSGKLPVAVCQIDPIDAVAARSPATEALAADKKAFRLESDIVWDIYVSGHPWLLCWIRDKLGEVGVGVTKFLKLMPETEGMGREDAKWLEINGTALETAIRERDAARADVYNALGVNARASGRDSGVASSGAQVAYEFEVEEGPALSALAHAAQRFERDILFCIALDTGIAATEEEAHDATRVAYQTREFGVKDAFRALSELATVKAMFGPAHPLTIARMNAIARDIEPNRPESWYTEIETANAGGAYVPPTPTFGFGDGEE